MTARVLAECAYQPFTWPDVVFVVGVVGVVAAVIVIVIWLVNR